MTLDELQSIKSNNLRREAALLRELELIGFLAAPAPFEKEHLEISLHRTRENLFMVDELLREQKSKCCPTCKRKL